MALAASRRAHYATARKEGLVSGDVHLAQSSAEIARCLPVMMHLRPHLVAAEFVGRVEAQQAQGFRLAYLEDDGAVVAVAGFRDTERLASWRTLYADNVVR